MNTLFCGTVPHMPFASCPECIACTRATGRLALQHRCGGIRLARTDVEVPTHLGGLPFHLSCLDYLKTPRSCLIPRAQPCRAQERNKTWATAAISFLSILPAPSLISQFNTGRIPSSHVSYQYFSTYQLTWILSNLRLPLPTRPWQVLL